MFEIKVSDVTETNFDDNFYTIPLRMGGCRKIDKQSLISLFRKMSVNVCKVATEIWQPYRTQHF